MVHAVFDFGVKRRGLPANPARSTDRRRERQRDGLETYTVDEVERLTEAMAEGAHLANGARNDADRAEDAQDAELVRVAAYTGLRQGELRALRWRDAGAGVVDLATTQRYLHARQASEQVERFARAFDG